MKLPIRIRKYYRLFNISLSLNIVYIYFVFQFNRSDNIAFIFLDLLVGILENSLEFFIKI